METGGDRSLGASGRGHGSLIDEGGERVSGAVE
jgi:hypothetical protein